MKMGYLATVGTFDGVHRGHLHLLAQLRQKAAERGLTPLVFALSPHPLAILRPGTEPALLSLPEARATMIHTLGHVPHVRLLSLSVADCALSGADFLARLKEKYGVEAFLMGFNNHIGSDRATAQDLADAPVPVLEAGPLPESAASSSAIRSALQSGDIERATALLGHSYVYTGHVVHGKQLGRTIGFPTANIAPVDPLQLMPAPGVYAVDILIGTTLRRGMANIGVRPTVDATGAPISFEVNIFDFDADLYGHTLDIAFISRLRDERRFDSTEALASQLAADRAAALKA